MKTYCKNLTIDMTLVREALSAWKRAESGHINGWRIYKEYGSEELLILELGREIRNRTLSFEPIKYRSRREPRNGKLRTLGQESVKQQIADYLAVLCLNDLINAKLGFYQVSSIKGKGILFGAKTIKKWCRDGGYWVHLDIKKCYSNIRHEDVMAVLRKYVRSEDVLYLCESLLNTYGNGLNIGSYFSLKISQLILSFGYHHVERLASYRRGNRRALVTHQLWYADDIYLFSNDKRNLKKALKCLITYMRINFGLSFHNWKISRVDDEGISAMSFVCGPERMTIKPKLFLRIKRAFQKFDENPNIHNARRVCSYWGMLKHSDSFLLTKENEYDRIFRNAKIYISSFEKRRRISDSTDKFVRTDRSNHKGLSKRRNEALAAKQYPADNR